MLYDAEAERELYLIFQDDGNYPINGIFKKGFKHVFALERQALGWMCIDPSRMDLQCHILPAGFNDDVITTFAAQNPTSTIMQLFIKPVTNQTLTYPGVGFVSCVSIMQYTLGVYWPLIVTPYQLYCRLSSRRINHIRVGNYEWTQRKEKS
jgi:hypothetical protein